MDWKAYFFTARGVVSEVFPLSGISATHSSHGEGTHKVHPPHLWPPPPLPSLASFAAVQQTSHACKWAGAGSFGGWRSSLVDLPISLGPTALEKWSEAPAVPWARCRPKSFPLTGDRQRRVEGRSAKEGSEGGGQRGEDGEDNRWPFVCYAAKDIESIATGVVLSTCVCVYVCICVFLEKGKTHT